MEVYKIDDETILIETETTVYYIWDYNYSANAKIAFDKFKKTAKEIEHQEQFSSNLSIETNLIHYKLANYDYMMRAYQPTIKIEQLLTHENSYIRKIAKRIIDEDI